MRPWYGDGRPHFSTFGAGRILV